jgi:hypothetical protein
VIGMVRHPTDRFLSEVTHSRRDSEDPKTFTESARAVRYSHLCDYLATAIGRAQARLQLITFGSYYCRAYQEYSDQELLSSAIRFAQLDNVLLAPSEHSDVFRKLLAKRLEFRPGVLKNLNANDPATRAAHQKEFNSVLGLIYSINAREREFYDFVCRSFGRLRTGSVPALRPGPLIKRLDIVSGPRHRRRLFSKPATTAF